MKIFSRILSLLVISTLGLFYAGCGGSSSDPDPVQKIQLAKLSKTWTLDAGTNAATLDDEDRTSSFPGFKLTVGGTYSSPTAAYQYTTSATSFPHPSPWIADASSTWTFGPIDSDGNGGQILTHEGISMVYKFTSTGLKLSFNCSGCTFNATGRVKEVDGDWVFNFH